MKYVKSIEELKELSNKKDFEVIYYGFIYLVVLSINLRRPGINSVLIRSD